MSDRGRVRAAMRVADYFAGGPYEMYVSQQPVVLQALEALRDAIRDIAVDVAVRDRHARAPLSTQMTADIVALADHFSPWSFTEHGPVA